MSYTLHTSSSPSVSRITVIELPAEGPFSPGCVHGRPHPSVCPHCMGLAFLQ